MSNIALKAKKIAALNLIERANDVSPRIQTKHQESKLFAASRARERLEDLMISQVPETIDDVLSLLTVLTYRLESALEGENEVAVNRIVDNAISGLIAVGAKSPLVNQYGGSLSSSRQEAVAYV